MTAQSSDDDPAPKAVAPGTGDEGAEEADRFFSLLRQKTEALVAGGIREGHARALAQLELRIAQWPSVWGNDLLVLIYGDFDAPPAELDFPELGITWRKRKGVAAVRLRDGTAHRAEVHWYEAHGIGRREFKIKFPLLD